MISSYTFDLNLGPTIGWMSQPSQRTPRWEITPLLSFRLLLLLKGTESEAQCGGTAKIFANEPEKGHSKTRLVSGKAPKFRTPLLGDQVATGAFTKESCNPDVVLSIT